MNTEGLGMYRIPRHWPGCEGGVLGITRAMRWLKTEGIRSVKRVLLVLGTLHLVVVVVVIVLFGLCARSAA